MENKLFKKRQLFLPVLFLGILLNSCRNTDTIEPQSVNSNKKLQEYLLRGWNTWNNADILNYVYLPEGLSLKIGFRESYISDPPYYIKSLTINSPQKEVAVKVFPVSHSSDGRYIDYTLIWKGFEARMQVVIQRGDILILYSPVRLPEHPPVIFLEVGMIWGKKGKIERNGKYVQAEVGTKILSIGTTQDAIDVPLPLSTLYLSFNSMEETGFFTGPVRTLGQIKEIIEKRKEIFYSKQKLFGDLSEAFNVIQSVLSWNLIYNPINHTSITTVSRNIGERMGGWVMYNADSYYASALFAIEDKFQAYSNAIAITRSITQKGFIPGYTAPPSTGNSLDHSQAPVGSLICQMIYAKYKEKWFLKEVYNELLTWNRWWDLARNNKGYLSWGSESEGPLANSKQAAMSESVQDNSPLFDNIAYNKNIRKMEVASVELMSLYITDCKSLAEIAGILGKEDDKAEILQRAEKYSLKLNDLWDDEVGMYRDKNLLSNQFCQHISATGFYSLLSGVPDKMKAERMINEHLLNPEEFSGDFMIPLLAKNDPAFSDTTAYMFWIRPELNFLVYLGLKNYDFPEARKIISNKSMNLVMNEWGLTKRIYRSYHPITGLGSDIPDNDSFYTTGGLLALISLIENGYWARIMAEP